MDLRQRYEWLVNAEYYDDLMGGVCEHYSSVCLGTKQTKERFENMSDPTGHKVEAEKSREKRFIVVLGAVLGLGGIGLGAMNSWQIHHMSDVAKQMQRELYETRRAVNFLHDGIESLDSKVDAIHHLVHEEIEYVWENLELLRCSVEGAVDAASKRMAFIRYENYLQHQVSAALQGAMNGILTSEILGSKSLRKLLNNSGYPDTSLVWREQSLVYKYGRLYPLLVDLGTMTFGYVL